MEASTEKVIVLEQRISYLEHDGVNAKLSAKDIDWLKQEFAHVRADLAQHMRDQDKYFQRKR